MFITYCRLRHRLSNSIVIMVISLGSSLSLTPIFFEIEENPESRNLTELFAFVIPRFIRDHLDCGTPLLIRFNDNGYSFTSA